MKDEQRYAEEMWKGHISSDYKNQNEKQTVLNLLLEYYRLDHQGHIKLEIDYSWVMEKHRCVKPTVWKEKICSDK